MDDRPFYYRLRGRTLGPVGLRQIRQLAQRAQIGRSTDVSRDGLQWGKAGDFPEIFEVSGDRELPAFRAASASRGAESPLEGALPAVSAPQWYYAVAGIQKGPVELPELQQMVATGQLSLNDHVFLDGTPDWVTVESVPQLANAGRSSAPTPIIINNTSGTSGPQEGSNGLAIAGFVLSLIGCSPIALILSLVALSGKNKANRGLAIAGAIISGLSILCGCGWLIFAFMVSAANAPMQ